MSIKKIIIFGFPHSGTTILRNIIGHIPNVYEVINETHIITDEMLNKANKLNKKYIIIKTPYLIEFFYDIEYYRKMGCICKRRFNCNRKNEHYNSYKKYDDYYKIFIIRNPYYIFSSMNKRFLTYPYPNSKATIELCEKTLNKYYINFNKKKDKTYFIKYEDMFENNFENIKNILDSIGLKYNNNIFNNKKYINRCMTKPIRFINKLKKLSLMNTSKTPSQIEKNHKLFRTWQINKPIFNMNNPNKLKLYQNQIDQINNSDIVQKLGYKIKNFSKNNIVN